jgi:ribosomal protein S16
MSVGAKPSDNVQIFLKKYMDRFRQAAAAEKTS